MNRTERLTRSERRDEAILARWGTAAWVPFLAGWAGWILGLLSAMWLIQQLAHAVNPDLSGTRLGPTWVVVAVPVLVASALAVAWSTRVDQALSRNAERHPTRSPHDRSDEE